MQPLVYISILNWNNYESTIRCVRMVEALTYSNKVILVVDNHSTNDSVLQIRAALPHIELIESPVNNGYASGHRLSVEIAQQRNAELVWLLNTDIEFENAEILNALVSAYQVFGNAIYGSLTLQSGTDKIPVNAYFLAGQAQTTANLVYNNTQPYEVQRASTEPIAVSMVTGASYLIPLDLIRQHGFMNENFFLYFEETDYCYRLARKGVATYLVPQSRLWHAVQGSAEASPHLRIVMDYYMNRNRFIMLRRYNSWYAFLKTMLRPYFFFLVVKALSGHFTNPHLDDITFRQYVYYCAWRDALIGRTGKTFVPEDYLA